MACFLLLTKQEILELRNPMSPSQLNTALERLAESRIRQRLYRMGFDSVHHVQYNKKHGVDLGAVKRNASGRVIRAAAVEVKGRSSQTPGRASFREQVRASYYMPRLELASKADTSLAKEILDFKAKGGHIESLAGTYVLETGQTRVYQISRRGPLTAKYA